MTLEKWIERFRSYDDGGIVFDYDKRTELLFFLEEFFQVVEKWNLYEDDDRHVDIV